MFLLFLLPLIMCFFTYMMERKKDSPTFIFCTIWTIVLFLFSLQIYPIYSSKTTAAIIGIMLISFPLGTNFYSLMLRRNNRFYPDNDCNETYPDAYSFRMKIFWIACAVSIIVMLLDEIEIIIGILSGKSFLNIISESGSAHTVNISGVKAYLYVFVVYPSTYFVSPICAAEIISGKSPKLPYIVVNVAIIFLAVMHHGARLMIIITIGVYIFTLYAYGKKIVIPAKMEKTLKICVILSVVIIISLSKSRGIEDVYGSFYMYFICEFPVCDGLIQSSEFYKPAMGYLSFNGIVYPVVVLLKALHYSPSDMYLYVQNLRVFIESNWIYIDKYNHSVNAFLPAGAFPYVDGGYVFELIVMFLSGYYSQKSYYLSQKYKNRKYIAIYSLVLMAIFMSFYRFYPTSYQFVIGLIYIFILYPPKYYSNYMRLS